MAKVNSQDSHFTTEVRHLINRFTDRTIQKDSVLDRAIVYFQQTSDIQQTLDGYAQELTSLNATLSSAKMSKKNDIKAEIEKLEVSMQVYQYQLQTEAQIRNQNLTEVCYQLIDLCEGENFDEALRKSAQFLGTLQLISPIEGKNIAVANERNKPVYKSILCLRLLDELILSNQISDPYILEYLGKFNGEKYRHFQDVDPEGYQAFIDYVKLPVVITSVLQDIGNYHPEAQDILTGGGNLDPYRTIDVEDRKRLLQTSFRETNRYIVEGLGHLKYVGNSREEKKLFVEREKRKVIFIRRLLKNAVNPKDGIGNLIKVPQIYTSIILSTKDSYNYKVLPKVYNVLNLNAERGACQQAVVDSLYKITGQFPQGYGISYVPKAVDGSDLDYYEYAVVSQFYPADPQQPLCRQATRNLSFISFGHDIVIQKQSNLFFQETAKRFSRVSKTRLLEILEQMSSNFEERKSLDILPRCWLPNDYFSVKNNQKLWNRAVQ